MREYKFIRVPCHGGGEDVPFVNSAKGIDLRPLIDSPYFQRLDRVKQLALAHLVFPGARNSRKEHSIGGLGLCYRLEEADGVKDNLSEKQKRVLRGSILLHDIGQPPFSHVSDVVLKEFTGKGHNDISLEKLMTMEREIRECDIDFDEMCSVFERKNPLWKIIWNRLGLDKLDYVTRDRIHVGVETSDVNRIIHYAFFDGSDFAVYEEAMPDIEDYFHKWLHSYKNIYYLGSIEIPEAMLRRALFYSIRKGEIEPDLIWGMDDNQLIYRLIKSESQITGKMLDRLGFNSKRERGNMKAVCVLKIEGQESTEAIKSKHKKIEGISEGDYARISPLGIGSITDIERRIEGYMGMEEGDVLITTSPSIDTLNPEDALIMKSTNKGYEPIGLFDVNGHLKDYFIEQKMSHYAVRLCVPDEGKRIEVYNRLKGESFRDMLLAYL